MCGVIYSDDGFLLNVEYVTIDAGLTTDGIYEYAFKAPKEIQWAEAAYDSDKYHKADFKGKLYYTIGELNEYQMYLVPRGYLRTKIKTSTVLTDLIHFYLKTKKMLMSQIMNFQETYF